MAIPCDKGPTLERIEQKLDMLTDIVSKQAVQENDIDHLGNHVRELSGKVETIEAWKNKWGGALVAMSVISTLLGMTLLLLRINEIIGA